jgi:large repetitive protein
LGLNPIAGPATGGTSVTLSAAGVSSATAVHFGSNEATEVEVVSPTEITAQAPPGSGTVPVTVSTSEGTTAETPADQYTYR